jgi:hypothetical protein
VRTLIWRVQRDLNFGCVRQSFDRQFDGLLVHVPKHFEVGLDELKILKRESEKHEQAM